MVRISEGVGVAFNLAYVVVPQRDVAARVRVGRNGCCGNGMGLLETQPPGRDGPAWVLPGDGRGGRVARGTRNLEHPTPWTWCPRCGVGPGCRVLGLGCAGSEEARQLHARAGCVHHCVQRRGHLVDDSGRPSQLAVLDRHRCREHLPVCERGMPWGAFLFAVYTLLAVDGWFDGISWFTLTG